MSNLHNLDPTGRFTGRAAIYAQCRPDYPAAALDHIMTRCALAPGSVIADIGAGTGIASRLFAERGLRVIGIEPNDDMRRQAEAVPAASGSPCPEYRSGRGEATGLPAASVDAVICCQAFHWLDAPLALAEFHRILKPGGWAALMWNERDESDPFTQAYGEIIRSFPNARSLEGARQRAGQAFMEHPLFAESGVSTFPHAPTMEEEQLIGRAMSVSYAPEEPADLARGHAEIRRVFRDFARAGEVVLAYCTSVFTGHRQD